MQNNISPNGPMLMHLYQKAQSLFQRKAAVPVEARDALQECKNMEQLLDFLFSTDFYQDEAFQALFQQRIEELDAAYSQQSFFTI